MLEMELESERRKNEVGMSRCGISWVEGEGEEEEEEEIWWSWRYRRRSSWIWNMRNNGMLVARDWVIRKRVRRRWREDGWFL